MRPQNISKELQISHFDQGIKLIPPQPGIGFKHNDINLTIADCCSLPVNIYFVNFNGTFNLINTECATMCGFDSENEAIGKTVFDFANKSSAEWATVTDKQVMLANHFKIFEQDLILKKDTLIKYLTIKMPWYDDKHKIIGLFGCSIALGIHDMGRALTYLINHGLLNKPASIQHINNKEIINIKMSKQQLACAKLLLTGMTLKEIAATLLLSHRTVETYVNNLKIKLGCVNKTELIIKLAEILN